MSAMVETLDAQMTDYNTSDDVFMQTHSDPWIPEDGTMDDDSFHSFSQTDVSKLPSMDSMVPIEASMSLPFSAISASNSLLPMGEDHAVEVEMEEYIEEPEYDMLDDEHVEEIHDVEVHDLQAAAAQRAPQISFSFSNETTTSIAEITSLVTPESSTSRQSPALTQESSADQPAHPQDNVETSFERTESSHAAPTEPTPDVPAEVSASAVGRVSETVELERRDPDATHPVEEAPEDDIRALPDAEPSEQEVLAPLLEEPQTPLPTSVEELQETVVVAEHVDEVSSEVPLSEPHEDHEDAAVEGSNPHEILAGVYIEPPPGVLLEVPSGHPSYSLFNLPSYSGHTTPSDEEANAVDDAIVLLHDRPTLFYEPIFSVFEALREEEPFSSSPDLRELELMFSFPSLNLVISEDNVYARQTSLHEVIMLHETFGGSGPLRAQLQLQSRFIIRFSELQAAMEQSAIGQNEEEVDIEVHADDQIPEIVEDATPEHAEAQHNEHSEREALPPSSHDGAPADVEGEAPSDVADLPDPDAVEPTNHAQEAQERAHAAAHSLPEPQSAASDETVAGEPAEVHEDMQNPPLERNDGGEEQDGESQNGIGDNIEEAADLVDYEEEFEGEEGEYYDEEHDESDATETPGDEYEHAEPTGAHEETDVVHETNLDEAALVVERAGSTFGDESNGTDDDGLHDVDQGLNEEQDRTIVEHAHVQEGDGHVAERERPGLNLNEHRHEGSTEESHHVEPFDEFPDFSELPELPEEEDELWDDEQDGEGELDLSEEHEYEPVEDNEESASNGTSVTLSSKGSKRAFSEVDDEYEEEDNGAHPPVHTPEKRTRLQ